MLRKITLLLSTLLLLGGLLSAGCGRSPSPEAEAEAEAEDRIDTIQERGTLRIGIVGAAPQVFRDPQTEEWAGAQVQLASRAAEHLEVEPEFIETSWETAIPSLLADKYDVFFGPAFQSPARALVVDFVEPSFTSGICPLARAERDDLQTLEDLNQPDVTWLVVAGSADEEYANRRFSNANVKPSTERTAVAILGALLAGRADVVFTNALMVSPVLQVHPELKVIPADCPDNPLKGGEVGALIAPGQPRFRRYLDAVVRQYKVGGEIDMWIDQYNLPEYVLPEELLE